MLQELSTSIRQLARGAVWSTNARRAEPLVRVGDGSAEALAVAQSDIAMLRGVTLAAADVAHCTCPEACERDHANE